MNRLHPVATTDERKFPLLREPTPENIGSGSALTVLPDFSGATTWINSSPLTSRVLRGKVVLVDFWTYSCINCLRSLPYIKAWNEKYKNSGLVVIGIHTPEFPFEKDESNVRKAVHDLGILYPVAMDNDYRIWRSFNNQYWPAHYFIDATGRIRFHHFGEGNYEESEKWIRKGLLGVRPANDRCLGCGDDKFAATGSEATPDAADIQSYETYVGYDKADDFISPGGLRHDGAKVYRIPADLDLNDWAFSGEWMDGKADCDRAQVQGRVSRFAFIRAICIWFWGPAKDGSPIRFRVTIDPGRNPARTHGVDTDAAGYGVVTENRLYQLIRQHSAIRDRTFRIEFLIPGVQAYSFTFG